jgi:hypothetical protein
LLRFEFESGIISFYFSFIIVSFRESCLLVSWCACGRCGIVCSDENRDRNMRPDAEDRDDRTDQILGGRAIERSGNAVCSLHRALRDEECVFFN